MILGVSFSLEELRELRETGVVKQGVILCLPAQEAHIDRSETGSSRKSLRGVGGFDDMVELVSTTDVVRKTEAGDAAASGRTRRQRSQRMNRLCTER